MNAFPTDLQGEEWRMVPGYGDRYAASSLGRVYAIPKIVSKYSAVAGRTVEQSYGGRLLTPCKREPKIGHLCVHLGVAGKRFNVSVHRLVLLAFAGPCPDGQEGCHNNGDASDNRIANLRWDTHFNNNQDRKNHGHYAVGEAHHLAKLTAEQVELIRSGKLSREDAGISKTHFSRLLKRGNWKHL